MFNHRLLRWGVWEEGEEPLFVASANVHGINIPTKPNLKLPIYVYQPTKFLKTQQLVFVEMSHI